jgi:hypothetical protein
VAHRLKQCPFPIVAFLASTLILGMPPAEAHADGEYWGIDISESTVGGVLSASRGEYTFGAGLTDYEDGVSAGLSLSRQIPLDFAAEGVSLSAGAALGFSFDEEGDLSDTNVGATANLQRYIGTEWGFVFLQGNVSTISRSFFLQAQVGFNDPDISFGLSRGGSTEYQELTLAVSKPLGDTPVSLRGGYRFFANEWFVGVSVNTF